MGQELGPMSGEELSAIYRTEMKTRGELTSVRKDLYRAMAALQRSQRAEYTRILAGDPDSIIAEGLNQTRKKNNSLCTKIVDTRMKKILQMAARGAAGADNPIGKLTDEEKTFYDGVYYLCVDHMNVFKGMSGTATYSSPDISEPLKAQRLAPEPMRKEVPKVPEPVPPEPTAKEMPPEEELVLEEEELEIPADDLDAPPAQEKKEEPPAPAEPSYIGKGMIMVRVSEDLPTFAGTTQNYTLRREDVVLLPGNLARALISAKKAVEVRPSP